MRAATLRGEMCGYSLPDPIIEGLIPYRLEPSVLTLTFPARNDVFQEKSRNPIYRQGTLGGSLVTLSLGPTVPGG